MKSAIRKVPGFIGLMAALLIGAPQQQKQEAQKTEVSRTAFASERVAEPAPAKQAPIKGLDSILNRITEAWADEKRRASQGVTRWFKSKRRYNRRAHRAAMNNWS